MHYWQKVMQLVDIHTHNTKHEGCVITIKNMPFADFGKLNSKREGLFSTGIHPWEVESVPENALDKLAEIIAFENVKIIGECGLDKNIATPFEKQLYLFRQQIHLSEKAQKPLIIHCVGYFNELFQLKNELKPTQRWIIHGFRGKPQLARQALQHGLDISFGEKYNPESVKITPLEHIFIETDESKLPVSDIYRDIAVIKQCNIDELDAGYKLICSK